MNNDRLLFADGEEASSLLCPTYFKTTKLKLSFKNYGTYCYNLQSEAKTNV